MGIVVYGEGLVLLIDLGFAPHKKMSAVRENNVGTAPPFPTPKLQERLQELRLTKDHYLGGRLATSLHTAQYVEKLRFAHQATVESPFVKGSTTFGFWERGDLLEPLNHMAALLTFTHGTRPRPSVPP